MAVITGNGGSAIFGTGTPLELGIGKWTLKKMYAMANAINSKSNKHKKRKATVRDDEFTIEFPVDDTDLLETTYDIGTTFQLVLEIGDSANKWTCTEAIMESIEYVNDNDEDIVRGVLHGFGQVPFVRS